MGHRFGRTVVRLTMKVLFIADPGNMPSIRLRLIECFDRYRAAGIEPKLLTPRSNIRERLKVVAEAGHHDVVVLHRTTGFSALQLRLLRRANPRLIFDFDDALMFRELKYGQPLSARTFAKFLRTIESCSAVVAGNEFLACFARGGNREVVVLPTAIEVTNYKLKTEQPGRGKTIGWLGLSDGFIYLQQIGPALRRLSEMFPELRLKVVSDKAFSLPGVRLENEIWRAETEQAKLAEFDVGIMPLSDSAWTRGKCSYKILQYMGVGTAVVASPVGMNREVIASGENGFLAATEDNWISSIGSLLENDQLRSRFGKAGRELVERKYSTERYAQAYIELMLRTAR
jgi:glycosyltransferase involved in cell wall biosynthesis